MSGDYSRHTFDPGRDFAAVLMQQGRVALDADWNELVGIVERRLRAETVDVIGRCAVPRETPRGFEITIGGTGSSKTLSIGRGRMYVHGLLAENHGPAPLAFDLSLPKPDGSGPSGVLTELLGGASVSYLAQPYWPQPRSLPAGDGPHLVYLDVWQREVTHLENPDLLETALGGVDTTTRLQTVWQVRLLEDVGTSVTCATPEADIPGWLDVIRPSGGRLTTRTVTLPPPADPCLVPPQSGYRGLENQLYRVEIHDGGAPGTATFKWSRDNATVATRVVRIVAADEIEAERVGRDGVLRFNDGDWVEITDDLRELDGRPGAMLRIDKVTDETRSIKLRAPLPADLVPSGTGDDTLVRRHTRIRRWDQRGRVLNAAGGEIVDLDDPGSSGVIPVPAQATTFVALESGIQVAFTIAPTGGAFRAMDHWTFAARTAEPGSIEVLDQAPPAGIHHHHGRLAVVTFPSTRDDCRVLWPPEVSGERCGCSVCVTPESHNGNTLTIQNAIDQVRTSGGTVCLGAGIYTLGATPLRIDGATSLRVTGQGVNTVLLFTGDGPAVIVENSIGVAVQELSVLFPQRIVLAATSIGGGPGVLVRNCAGVTVERCAAVQAGDPDAPGTAIALGQSLLGVTLARNVLFARTGIAGPAPDADDARRYLLLANLVVRDNVLRCPGQGIALTGITLHATDTSIRDNTVTASTAGAIVALGAALRDGRIDITGNLLLAAGRGIVVGTSHTRVHDNDVRSPARQRDDALKPADSGLVLAEGLDPDGVDDCQVVGNRITDAAGHGVLVEARLGRVMITSNTITRAAAGGIVMAPDAGAGELTVEHNVLVDVAPSFDSEAEPVAALRFLDVERLAVVGNSAGAVGAQSVRNPFRGAVDVLACRGVRVAGNHAFDVGPANTLTGRVTAGIRVVLLRTTLHVSENRLLRSTADPDAGVDGSDWFALLVVDADAFKEPATSLAVPLLLAAKSEVYVLGRTRVRAVPVPAQSEVTIHGNHVRAWGGAVPAVEVVASGPCVFDGNQCLLLAGRKPPAVVRLAAPAVAVATNVVRRTGDDDAIHIPTRSFTVLGNVTMGNIRVQGPSGGLELLPDPWKPLNILAP